MTLRLPSRPPRRASWLVSLLAAAFLSALLYGPAAAHADLIESQPADGDVVLEPLAQVELIFDEALFDGTSSALRGPDGSIVGTGVVSTDDPSIMTIAMPGDVEAGAYEVRWTSVARDGDVLRGQVAFRYAPAASSTASPAATAAPGTVDEEGASTAEVALPIVLGLGLVALFAAFLLRRTGRRSATGESPGDDAAV